jgi:ribosomal protein S18 acetylase RimI-like enzyme
MFRVRTATFADRATIAHHRVSMFRDMGRIGDGQVDELRDATMAYLADAIPKGEYVGWFVAPAVTPSRVVAGCGLSLRNIQPFPWCWPDGTSVIAGGREALVVNVYTEKEFRRMGLARRLMTSMLEWGRMNRLDRIVLHAAPDGRPLYESLGFEPTNEMRYMGDLR